MRPRKKYKIKRKIDTDSPEQISFCLDCPAPDCRNCFDAQTDETREAFARVARRRGYDEKQTVKMFHLRREEND